MSEKKISLIKIQNDDVKEAVFDALKLINAEKLFQNKPQKVLLKPNLLMPKAPEEGTTTNPAVLSAAIQWVKQYNPKKIIVADSSGTQKRGKTEESFEKSGLKEVCEQEGVEWTSFEATPRKIYQVENPLVLDQISVSTLLEEADIIINLPKIKTHGQCTLTCCIKNMFGTLILGNKPRTHAKFPKLEDFCAALTDIYSVSKPQLTIIDGYYGMEGNGPSAGDIVKMDTIIAGYDPIALDTLVCNLIDFDPRDIIYLEKGESKKLGTTKLENFEIVGESIKSMKTKFEKPPHHPISVPLPRWLAEYASEVIFKSTVKFDLEKCRLCGTCWENCPVDAISPPEINDPSKYIPSWDRDKCITCYCCAELCPYEAVDFKVNILKNVLTSWLGVGAIVLLIMFIWFIWFLFSLIF
ncbi:MAG: DUF362 domain-containing protein [Promethearchaeia archaeon]